MPIYRTQDSHKDPRLQTRWYQNDYKESVAAVMNILKNFGFNLKHQDDNFGEFIFERKGDTLDVRVISLQRKQTAIDFNFNVSSFLDFGRGKTVINELYQRLDKMLTQRKFV